MHALFMHFYQVGLMIISTDHYLHVSKHVTITINNEQACNNGYVPQGSILTVLYHV